MRLFVGDDWAEDHHDVEVMDPGRDGAGEEAAARGRSGDDAVARADRPACTRGR